jgi:hypothetical protein
VLARTGDKQPGVEAEQQRLQRQRPRDQARGSEERRACCRAAALAGVHRRAEQAQDPHTSAGARGLKRQRASIGTPAAHLTASCLPDSTTPSCLRSSQDCAPQGRTQSKQTLEVQGKSKASGLVFISSLCGALLPDPKLEVWVRCVKRRRRSDRSFQRRPHAQACMQTSSGGAAHAACSCGACVEHAQPCALRARAQAAAGGRHAPPSWFLG